DAKNFEVASVTPDGKALPVVDFSSFDITLTQPVVASTVKYGSSVKLVQGGKTVPATLLVNGRKLTIDPDYCLAKQDAARAQCEADEKGLLVAGEPVTLTLSSAIASQIDKADGSAMQLKPFSATFTPADSAPRATMIQRADEASANGCLDANALTS